jgi:hypothetical protein
LKKMDGLIMAKNHGKRTNCVACSAK